MQQGSEVGLLGNDQGSDLIIISGVDHGVVIVGNWGVAAGNRLPGTWSWTISVPGPFLFLYFDYKSWLPDLLLFPLNTKSMHMFILQ